MKSYGFHNLITSFPLLSLEWKQRFKEKSPSGFPEKISPLVKQIKIPVEKKEEWKAKIRNYQVEKFDLKLRIKELESRI